MDQFLEAAKADHPELVAEFIRIHAWVAACLGEEVAAWNGLPVDHGTEKA
jgi:hypothetical protein